MDNIEMSEGSPEIEAAIKEAEQREKDYLAAGNQGTPETKTPVAKPDDVPEEFWDAENGKVDWDKVKAAKTPDDKSKEQTSDEQAEPSEEINGVSVSDDHRTAFAPWYEALQKGEGIPDEAVQYVKDQFKVEASKAMIEAYMQGQLAKATGKASEEVTAVRSAALSAVPDGMDYSSVATWAEENLSDQEKADYNAAVEGKDPKVAKLAVENLVNKFRAESDQPPVKRLGNGRTNAPVADAYNSVDEITADMMKPEYDRDPAFRAKVDAKIQRSGSIRLPKY